MSKARCKRHARRRTHGERVMNEILRKAAIVFGVKPMTMRDIARFRARYSKPVFVKELREAMAQTLRYGNRVPSVGTAVMLMASKVQT